MDVKEIVLKYLTDNGFDGLCCVGCGCKNADLFCCSEGWVQGCQPGHDIKCNECEADCDYRNEVMYMQDGCIGIKND